MIVNDELKVEVELPWQLPDKTLKCTGETNLQELITLGVDAYAAIYQPVGYSLEEYGEAVRDNPIIYTLRDMNNHTIYRIPKNVIITTYSRRDIGYSDKALVIRLGSFPVSYDLSNIAVDVEHMITARLGVTAKGVIKRISNVVHIPLEEHNALMAKRNEITGGVNNAYTRARECSNEIAKLHTIINELEKFIKEMVDCKGLSICCNRDGTPIDDEGEIEEPPIYKLDMTTFMRIKRNGCSRRFGTPSNRIMKRAASQMGHC